MKVLILSLAFAPYSGVGAARMTSLSKYLLKQGCSVTVVCYDSRVFGEREQDRPIPEGVERICVEKLPRKRENRENLQRAVERVVQAGAFQVCISSVGPFDTMPFVHDVWDKWRVPYVIDYRDPWLFEKSSVKPKGVLKYKVALHDRLYQWVERRAVRSAGRIVSVTEKCNEDLIGRYHLPAGKCRVIHNGYEDVPEGREREGKRELPGGLVIGIAGKFAHYHAAAAKSFLEVCEELSDRIPIKLVHVGRREEELEGLSSKVYCNKGEKGHLDAMRELAEADVLLICYAHVHGLGTKVFDYVALNKPILYIGCVPSELADFVGRFENSYVCGNREQMEDALRRLCRERPSFLTKEGTQAFSRECQNERYWQLLQEMTSGGNHDERK